MKKILLSEQDEGLRARGWHVDARGYVRRTFMSDGAKVLELLHRVVTQAPEGSVVDHINGDKLDNRRENLRVCSHAENMRNRKTAKSNSLGLKGVYRDRFKFRAQIRVDHTKINLGTFESADEAKAAYDKAAVSLHQEFARFS